MATAPLVLLTPEEVHHVRTPEAYRADHQRVMVGLNQRFPGQGYQVIAAPDHPAVFVSGGKWVIVCTCGNAPSVHPAWQLACCYECGRVYTNLTMPGIATEVQAVLVEQPMKRRHWTPDQSLADLKQTLGRS